MDGHPVLRREALRWPLALLGLSGFLAACGDQASTPLPTPTIRHASPTVRPTKTSESVARHVRNTPLNPRAGYGALKATIDGAWPKNPASMAVGIPCSPDLCGYYVHGIQIGVRYGGPRHSANDVQLTDVKGNADVWASALSMLPGGAKKLGCETIKETDQGGPGRGCVFRWQRSRIEVGQYLDLKRKLRDYDARVVYLDFRPYDDMRLASPSAKP